MKMFIASALMISSLSVFAKVEVKNYGDRKEFDQFVVSSDKAGVITVNVDRDVVRVDCHGLPTSYSKDVLSTGDILVSKQNLMHTMNMCPPGLDRTAISGISFTVTFKNNGGGYQTILAPVNAKVTVQQK